MKFFKRLLRELNNVNTTLSAEYKHISLERQFLNEVKLRKHINFQHVWSSYYVPLAAKELLNKQGYLTANDNFKLECLANSMMFKDLADGKLNELYKFD